MSGSRWSNGPRVAMTCKKEQRLVSSYAWSRRHKINVLSTLRTELRREVGGTLFLDSGAGHVLLWQVVEESAKLFRYLI